jgi:hypothetical protein
MAVTAVIAAASAMVAPERLAQIEFAGIHRAADHRARRRSPSGRANDGKRMILLLVQKEKPGGFLPFLAENRRSLWKNSAEL